jgi:hypothetical protein
MSDAVGPTRISSSLSMPSRVLWARDGWVVTVEGLAESNGDNSINRDNLADVRADGLLSVPIYTAAGPGLNFAAFRQAFRAALRLHQLPVDPAVIEASESAALRVLAHSQREASTWKAHRHGRRGAEARAPVTE